MLQSFFLPARCLLCGARGQGRTLDICAACEADLPRNARCCLRCADTLPEAPPELPLLPQPSTLSAAICGRCTARPPHFDRAVVPYRYAYPIDRLVQRLKYEGALPFGRVLGMLLAAAVRSRAREDQPQALLPVPLHIARHRERGFNQACELARPVSRLLRIPVDDRLCRRMRNTADQTGLLAGQRRKNLRRAFAVVRPSPWIHVALIDDVVTTGSTTGELARALKRAGAERVEVWAVARATRQ